MEALGRGVVSYERGNPVQISKGLNRWLVYSESSPPGRIPDPDDPELVIFGWRVVAHVHFLGGGSNPAKGCQKLAKGGGFCDGSRAGYPPLLKGAFSGEHAGTSLGPPDCPMEFPAPIRRHGLHQGNGLILIKLD